MKLTDDVQREIDDFLARAQADLVPKMRASAFTITILDGQVDMKLALEVGCALLLEKPLLVLAIKGAWVPQRIIDLADAVVRIDDMTTPESKEKVYAGIRLVAEKFMAKRA